MASHGWVEPEGLLAAGWGVGRWVLGGQGHREGLPAGHHLTRRTMDWALLARAEGWVVLSPGT